MNWVLILAILLVAGNIVWGYFRGFLRVIYSVVVWILIVVFVTWATPHVSEWITRHTAVDDRIEENLEERFRDLIQNDEDQETTDTSEEDLEQLGIILPDSVLEKLVNPGRVADELLQKGGVYQAVASEGTALAVRAISFGIVLVLAMIIFHLISFALGLVDKLPLIGEVDHTLGGVAGFVKSILLLWLIFAFIAMGSATELAQAWIGQIYESPLLIWFYENNFVLTILMSFL
jgi:energy-coupling factor transporter transmembrane protein EcfT